MRNVCFVILLLYGCLSVCSQQRGVFTASVIPDSVFSMMQGKSFANDCRIKRDDLRLLRLSYYDAEGKTHIGEMIVNKAIAKDVVEIFGELYDAKYPIERMQLIDVYDADDEKSMTANNTSAFNYRTIAGTNIISKHGKGMAIDINPLYNPCVHYKEGKITKVEPSAGWRYADRKKGYRYKIVKGDLCYRLFIKHGFTWGGSWHTTKDYQHFEKD